jgi:NAD(P)-dependent dehydrogenase (short-subunit alcohol dehydrogenase family)
MECDHADPSSLDRLLANLADIPVSVLVNAQFYFAMESPGPLDLAQWNRSLAVNLTAPVYLFRHLQSSFSRPASVVTVTSTEAYRGSFGATAYAATKAAIHNATMTLANLGGASDVRVNAVAAGWIGGVMDTDEVFNMSRSVTPLARLGSPDEIAACVAFLASPESSFVNGSVVVADGGYLGVDSISKFEFEAERD